MTELRMQLTRRQGPIGQRPGARPDGNTTKQIKLRLTVPGYGPSDASILETLLSSAIDRFEYQSADETEPEPGQAFPEGSVTRVTVNKYERDPAARKKCLATYGHKCTVCDLDFEDQYGDIGKDFIHVHHLKELSTVGPGYSVDPLRTSGPSARTATRCCTSAARRSPLRNSGRCSVDQRPAPSKHLDWLERYLGNRAGGDAPAYDWLVVGGVRLDVGGLGPAGVVQPLVAPADEDAC